MKSLRNVGWIGGVGLAALVLGSGCDAPFDPFAEGAPAHFSLAGYLDTRADTQFVRVAPLRTPGGPVEGAAGVTSHEPGAGAGPLVWQDSLVRLDDGSEGLLYWAAFRPALGAVYDVRVEGEAGSASTARVTIPGPAPFRLGLLEEANGAYRQEVTLEGIDQQPLALARHYTVLVPRRVGGDRYEVRTFAFDVPQQVGRLRRGDFSFEVNLSADRLRMLERLGRLPTDSTLVFVDLLLDVTLLSAEWRDAAPTNIEGGLGFFGGVGRFALAWPLDPATVCRLGYRPGEDAACPPPP